MVEISRRYYFVFYFSHRVESERGGSSFQETQSLPPRTVLATRRARAATYTRRKGSVGSHLHEFVIEGRYLDSRPSSI